MLRHKSYFRALPKQIIDKIASKAKFPNTLLQKSVAAGRTNLVRQKKTKR